MTTILWTVAAAAALAMVASMLMVVGIRTHSRPVMRTVTRAQRAWLNPRALKTAGQPGEYSVIRHVGRKSGNRYETPVGVVAVEDTFLIALPYGTTPDWLKNVMAAGSAELVHEGETVSVHDPRVVAMKHWLHLFPRADQRAQRVFGVDQALILRRATWTDLASGLRERVRSLGHRRR